MRRLELRFPLLALAIALALSGLFRGLHLIRAAEPMSAFTDTGRVERLQTETPPSDPKEFDLFAQNWHRDLQSLRTEKWDLHDRGVGLIIFSACLLSGIGIFRVWRPNLLQSLATPKPLVVVSLGLAIYLSLTPLTFMYVVDEAERGLLPSWGDSIALPIFGMLFLQLIGLPFVAVTLWVLGRRARRTSSLWVRSDYSSIYSGVVAALAAIATLGLLYFITIEVLRGPGYGLPTLLGLGYLILVVRALVVSPVNSDEREQGQ